MFKEDPSIEAEDTVQMKKLNTHPVCPSPWSYDIVLKSRHTFGLWRISVLS